MGASRGVRRCTEKTCQPLRRETKLGGPMEVEFYGPVHQCRNIQSETDANTQDRLGRRKPVMESMRKRIEETFGLI